MTFNLNIKKTLLVSSKLFLFFLCCWLIFKNITSEKNFYNVFSKLDIKYILIILLLTTLSIFIQIFIQFNTFLKIKKIKINFHNFYKIFLNSQLASIILPHSGLVYNAYKLNKLGLSYKDFLNIKVFLAWFYLSFLSFLYSFEILIFGYATINNFIFPIFIFGILISSSLIIIPLFFKKFIKFNFKNNLITKIYDVIKNAILSPLNYNKENFFNFLIRYGLIIHIVHFLIIYLLFLSLNINQSFSLIILFFVINSFLDQIPITPKNLAISELIFGLLSTEVGLGFEFGVAIKLCLRIFFFTNLIIMSLVYNVVKYDEIK